MKMERPSPTSPLKGGKGQEVRGKRNVLDSLNNSQEENVSSSHFSPLTCHFVLAVRSRPLRRSHLPKREGSLNGK